MSEDNAIFQIEKNSGERLVFRSSHYKGHSRLDLRTHYRDKDGVYHPTRKGVSLSNEQWRNVVREIQAVLLSMESATA